MTSEPIMTSVSELVGARVIAPSGRVLGRVHEFAVDTQEDGTNVTALLLRVREGSRRQMRMVPIDALSVPTDGVTTLRASAEGVLVDEASLPHFLLLERDLLDQQIIDIDGHKVVRVNDVALEWAALAPGPTTLRIVSVEVGVRGASRRLLKGLPQSTVAAVAGRLPSRAIPWEFVDLIEQDPARRVRLKVGQKRLENLHPSDIADILEELAPAEREALFVSLPEETAAETLEEVAPRLQKELLEGMSEARAADIIEEMDPGTAADVLAELSDERSEAILEEMEPEERQEVSELLEFAEESAAGQMTPYFVGVAVEGTAADAIAALRDFVERDEGDVDTIAEVYLLDSEQKLAGVVSAARLLLARSDAPLLQLTEGHKVTCDMDASRKQVAELFDKYNLLSLPVVDDKGRVQGAVYADQVIAQLRGE
jgi:magnesium transporter